MPLVSPFRGRLSSVLPRGEGLTALSGSVDTMLSAVDVFRNRVEGGAAVTSSPVGLSTVGLRQSNGMLLKREGLQSMTTSPTRTIPASVAGNSLLERCWHAAVGIEVHETHALFSSLYDCFSYVLVCASYFC